MSPAEELVQIVDRDNRETGVATRGRMRAEGLIHRSTYEEGTCRVWGRAFSCVWDGEITLQAEEIESGEFVAPEEILRRAENEPYTPDGLQVLRRYLWSP